MMWRDGVFIPHDRIKRYCDDTFGEGEIVTFERHEERSTVSHNHYFASIQTAWDNLPEKDDRFPNPEALRKWALIKAGYCTEATTVLDTEEQANTIAGFMGHQEGVIIVVKGPVIKKYTAKSQAVAAMGKQEFQRSKDAVLDIIAQLIEVSRKRLEDNAGRAA
jgi:hypothetical protein